MFMPYEIIIIGTMICLHKQDVSNKEVQAYIKRRGFKIELEHNNDSFQFIEKTENGFHINQIPHMNPAMIQFLAQ